MIDETESSPITSNVWTASCQEIGSMERAEVWAVPEIGAREARIVSIGDPSRYTEAHA